MSVGEHVAAELEEERVVVPLVRILRVVDGPGRPIGHFLVTVDRPDGADIRLVAGRTGRALVLIDVQDRVAEDPYRVRIRNVFALDGPAPCFGLREQSGRLRVVLVDALHRTDVNARAVLDVDARLGDDCNPWQ